MLLTQCDSCTRTAFVTVRTDTMTAGQINYPRGWTVVTLRYCTPDGYMRNIGSEIPLCPNCAKNIRLGQLVVSPSEDNANA